jgi:ubiquinone/menaquinone biosynthesis C-methylase UbiE/uncharacterized protein YbaR (Trm112 family)
MRPKTIELLMCPRCSHYELTLDITGGNGNEVESGHIVCSICNSVYPVINGIPKMLELDLESGEREHERVRDANITYHDTVAGSYESSLGEAFQQAEFFERRLENIMTDLSKKCQGGVLLDVGCGTGKILKHAEKVFENVIGVDISFNMLKIAKERGHEVIQADALFLPFRVGAFDIAVIYSVLHHIYDYASSLIEVSRVIKTGGLLYTDWDPNKIQPYGKAWPSTVMSGAVRMLLGLAHRSIISEEEYAEIELENRCDADLIKTAEYHNLGEDQVRGVDFELIKAVLLKEGFVDVTPSYHWHGYNSNQLIRNAKPLPTRILLQMLKRLRIQLEPYMENIMIIAQK